MAIGTNVDATFSEEMDATTTDGDPSTIDGSTFTLTKPDGAMGKRVPQKRDIPVIALHTALEEELSDKETVIRVPWPCKTKALVDHIETALLDAPAASTSPATQAGTE